MTVTSEKLGIYLQTMPATESHGIPAASFVVFLQM